MIGSDQKEGVISTPEAIATPKTFTYDEAIKASEEYFDGEELPANIFVNKYAMKDGRGNLLETNPDEMHIRMAREFWEAESQYITKRESNELRPYHSELSSYGQIRDILTEDRIYNYFKKFKYIVPQGSVMAVLGNKTVIASLSNCTVLPEVFDSYGGIIHIDQILVQLQKRRCGCGIDISTLRPAKSTVTNAAGSSTGPVSFMHRFSNTTREVAQGGRRGALMITIDIAHPDVEDFITIKQDLTQVTGANISIRLSDEFMEAVDQDKEYTHRWPIDSKNPSVTKTIKAKSLWNTIIKCAHNTAEPGLIFWDRQHKYSTSSVYPGFKNTSTNPCVTGDTMILTDKGYVRIDSVVDTEISVSNGFEFSKTTPKVTGRNEKILKITFSNGLYIKCTHYHEFILCGNYTDKIKAKDLKVGDVVPTIETTINSHVSEQVVSIEDDQDAELVYCFNEPLRHLGVFNSILTGQCSEIAMQGGDSCRLMAVNLYSFVKSPFTDKAEFNFDKFYEVIYESQRLMDDLVELELKAIAKIIAKIKADPEPEYIKQVELDTWKLFYETGKKGRRTGLGFTALADAIAALGFKYDSSESIAMVDRIMRKKLIAEFDSSIDMALERGTFEGFNADVDNTSEFVHMMKKEFPDQYERMMKHGRRNISISTVAPTGTLSLLTESSSGMEPVFMTGFIRRKKVNPADKKARVDFTDANGDKWQEFKVFHPKQKVWMDVTGNTDESLSPYAGSTAPEIDWMKRVEMQSVIQKYVTHSISSTINLPKDVPVEKVGEIYMHSWKMGLKGITVYRDGSRSGVLISDKKEEEIKPEHKENHARKRPKSMECDVMRISNKGEKWIGFVGTLEGRPYEVFTGTAEGMEIPSSVEEGRIVKSKTPKGNRYDFIYEKDGKEIVVEELNKCFDKHYHSYAKMISAMLRHNMPLHSAITLIDSLEFDKDNITTWKAGVMRMLKKYIADGTKAGDKKCKECGAEDSVIYQEGCLVCNSCGSSKCG